MKIKNRAATALVLCCALANYGTANAIPPVPTLQSGSETLVNACTPSSQAKLRKELAKPANKVSAPAEALRLVHTLMCAPRSAAATAYLREHVARTVTQKSAATGSDDETATIRPDSELIAALPRGGDAWGAEVQAYGDEVVLIYWSDEATVEDRTLAYTGGRWRIVGIGSAAD
jgi:hypothetical protein